MRRLVLVVLMLVVVLPSAASAGTRAEPEAADECGAAEIAETYDLTYVDAPWADMCAAWVDTTTADHALETLTVTAQVAGNVAERTHTSTWSVRLYEGDCEHVVQVSDDAVVADGLSVHQTTSCGYTPAPCPEPFPTIEKTLEELGIGSGCFSEGSWRSTDKVDLPTTAVTFGADTISVTLNRAQLSPDAQARLVPGTAIHLDAWASSGTSVATGETRDHVLLDADMASSTGRTHTIPD
jgi:hypothetical protein